MRTTHPAARPQPYHTVFLLHRLPPPRRRRGFTLLELLVVLVLLGLGAFLVVPVLRLPGPSRIDDGAIQRARATAIRRGESVRLTMATDGVWSVRATADTGGAILLSGAGADASGTGQSQSIVITALGACLPEGAAAVGVRAWDPARCTASRH